MTSDDRNAYAKYRLEKAEEAYISAEVLILHQQWNSAINRLYYSAYYAVSGILAKMGIETKTHAGIKTQFLLHYIKTGKVEMQLGKLYADLFDWRQRGDYGDFFDFKEEDILPLMAPTRALLDAILLEIDKLDL